MASILSQLEILQLFCTVIQAFSGWPTVIGDQDAPPPKGSYVSLRILDVEPPTHDISEFAFTDTTANEIFRGQSYCNMELIVFGPPSMDMARQIVTGLQLSGRQGDLFNTIGFGGFTGPQNLSESYGGMWRQKALVNVFFYANLSYENAVDYSTNGSIEVVIPGKLDVTFTD
jgi:hypothetical protein